MVYALAVHYPATVLTHTVSPSQQSCSSPMITRLPLQVKSIALADTSTQDRNKEKRSRSLDTWTPVVIPLLTSYLLMSTGLIPSHKINMPGLDHQLLAFFLPQTYLKGMARIQEKIK